MYIVFPSVSFLEIVMNQSQAAEDDMDITGLFFLNKQTK